ncbi:hypothetical protein, partial [Enterobacter bugandensis]|uniref:hypothetical protein n=1 Tax=Enterobacter bugandensis TaxID=881260 RepID=UPI001954A022
PISIREDSTITNPKLVSNSFVNTVVCVRKPGPIDELAIKKAAPSPTPPMDGILNRLNGNIIGFKSLMNFLCK